MKIRKATTKDILRIAEILRIEYSKEPYNERWSNETAHKRVGDYINNNEIFVLENDNKIVGFIIMSTYMWDLGLKGHIDEIVVDSNYHGKGFGRRLMDFAEEHFKKKGAKKISLFSSTKSKAFEVYKHFGYTSNKDYVFMEKEIR